MEGFSRFAADGLMAGAIVFQLYALIRAHNEKKNEKIAKEAAKFHDYYYYKRSGKIPPPSSKDDSQMITESIEKKQKLYEDSFPNK